MADDIDDNEDGDEAPGIPEWVVTFGDMMSLLLTFFIMLVSLSEIKQDEKYQALVESIKRSFGHTTSVKSMIPGESRPRNSDFETVRNEARAKRQDTHSGGDKVKAPVGDNKTVRIVRPGTRTAVGTAIVFSESETVLGKTQKNTLEQQCEEFRGKPHKIEIRGHTSRKPLPPNSPYQDHLDLAYARCKVVRDYLVNYQNIDPVRIRIAVAGAFEPQYTLADPELMKLNPRVEVFILDEVTDDLVGSPSDDDDRTVPAEEFN